MLIKYFIFIFIVIPVLAQGYNLENATFSNIKVSGFIDFISSYSNSSADKTYISLGQVELDFAKDLNLKSSVEIAIVYNNDESLCELGAAVLDLHLFGFIGDRHTTGFHLDHSSLLIGMFDVPFGIDYQSYASIDRKLITAPRVVNLTHDGWNDLGVNLTLENSYSNLSLFLVNGFESSANNRTMLQIVTEF